MNAARLRSLIDRLLQDENQFGFTQQFKDLVGAIGNVVGQPGDAAAQTAFANKLSKLGEHLVEMLNTYQPVEVNRLEEIGALEFYGPNLVHAIREEIAQNSMTPAVVQKSLSRLEQRREKYIQALRNASESLDALKIKSDTLIEGDSEIGFQIPRELFDNNLDGLIGELRVIQRIIRAFAEAKTGTAPSIEVRQISTTDPIFFFGLDIQTVLCIGGATTWALDTWERLERIRKVRSETASLPSFKEAEIESFFGDKIREIIDQSVGEKVDQLIEPKQGRENEQRIDLKWALESLLARVERGMTVEIRFLTPKSEDDTEVPEGDKAASENIAVFETLAEITPKLVFPAREASPVVKLPPSEPSSPKQAETKKPSKKPS